MKLLARISAVCAFLLCAAAGLWVLSHVVSKDDFIWVGMGLYLIGKAFFVGPMLWLAAERSYAKNERKSSQNDLSSW